MWRGRQLLPSSVCLCSRGQMLNLQCTEFSLHEVGIIIITILQRRKLSLTEVPSPSHKDPRYTPRYVGTHLFFRNIHFHDSCSMLPLEPVWGLEPLNVSEPQLPHIWTQAIDSFGEFCFFLFFFSLWVAGHWYPMFRYRTSRSYMLLKQTPPQRGSWAKLGGGSILVGPLLCCVVGHSHARSQSPRGQCPCLESPTESAIW